MIELGIVGCGDVAFRTYLPGLAMLAGRARVAACFDPVGERRERFAADAGDAEAYDSYDALLAHPGLDAIINLSPAPFHQEINAAALDAGLHCFSEKPLAANVEQAQALIEQARRRDRLLLCAPAVMVTTRFRWLRDLLASGRLGRPTLATAQMANMGPAAWRDYKGDPAVFYQPGVGPLLDTGVYSLHAMTGLLGPARRVSAVGGIAIPQRRVLIPERLGQTVDVTTNDQMLIHLDFGDTTFAQLLSSFAVPRSKAPALEIHGTDGSISISQPVWYDVSAPVDILVRDESPGAVEDWAPATPPVASPVRHLIQAGPAHFVACIEGSEEPVLTAEHATHVLEIILKAERSARDGHALALETTF